MNEIAIQLRFLQIFYHNAHNLVGRQSFFSDHSFMGDAYSAMEGAYDDVVERMIGTGESVDLKAIIKTVAEKIQDTPVDAKQNKVFFDKALELETELVKLLDGSIKSDKTSEGTKDLLAGLASDAEVRLYKIKQRLVA